MLDTFREIARMRLERILLARETGEKIPVKRIRTRTKKPKAKR